MSETNASGAVVTRFYVEKRGWLIARHLLAASPFPGGMQLRSWGTYSGPELRVGRDDFEALLRRELPEMTGCDIGDHMIEVTSPLPEEEVLDRLRIADRPRPPARSARIVPELYSTVTVFPCGFGVVSENNGYQFFRHDLDLGLIGNEEALRAAFWGRINRRLPVPFYDGEEPRPKVLTTLRGTVEEFKGVLGALGAALCEKVRARYLPARFPVYSHQGFAISTARSRRSLPQVTSSNGSGFAVPDLKKALELISRHYHPIGTRTVEKVTRRGHAGHAYSNFKLDPLRVEFTLAEDPPAREVMAARGRLRRWFVANAHDELALVEKLCGESAHIDVPGPTPRVAPCRSSSSATDSTSSSGSRP